MTDAAWIQRCLALAETWRGRTSPNPIVGCVIVSAEGVPLAEGVHRGPGTPHAEADALAKLGGRAPGATLYVNLEPCNHHGRTPPCAPAVRDAGVARVVIGALDPVPGHAGGAELLRAAGIEVVTGVLEADCVGANRAFYLWAARGRCTFTLKAGMTLDGRIATATGESRWITGEAARADAHRLRDTHDAILVGVGTVLADDPQLTVRRSALEPVPITPFPAQATVAGPQREGEPRPPRDPVRVILDSRLRTPLASHVLSGGRTIVATCAQTGELPGAELWRFSGAQVPLPELAVRLADAGLLSVLVEGGAQVHASLLGSGLADELVLYLAPLVLGGTALPWVGGTSVATLAAAHRFRFTSLAKLGDDLRLTAFPA